MVKWEEILEKVLPIAIVAGVGIWLLSQIKAKGVEISEVEVA